MKTKNKKLINLITLIVAFSAVYAFCAIFNTTCPIKYITHFPCPGCGLTRAFLSLLKFDFKSAWNYNPMFLYVPLILLEFIFDGKLFKKKHIDSAVMILGLIGFSAVFIYRLILFFKYGIINV